MKKVAIGGGQGFWGDSPDAAIHMIRNADIQYVVLLPICGGTYNQTFLSTAVRIVLVVGAIGNLLTTIGISAYDKPETFEGTSQHETLNLKGMLNVLKGNKPLQSYIAAAASDKIAQQVGSQAIINTLFSGIVIGNMGIATILGIISMVPSLFFAAFGAKYVGKHGSKKGIVTWTYVSMAFTALLILFLIFTDPKQIGVMGSWNMIVYVLLTILQSGSNFHGREILPHQCQRTFILFQVVPSQIDSIFHSTISL